jgi:acetylornithine deacetylase/succinyl-diaminopimelate desuccinylase-like protein
MVGFAFDGVDRRKLLLGFAAAAAVIVAPGPGVAFAADDLADVKAALAKNHAVAVKRLQDWIALPSIAAENRAPKEGADHMAQLARDAGFQHVEVVPTAGMPGVFATLDAGAAKTLGVYFMYDVKQFDPKEWSSPPLEARLIDKPGMGKIVMGRGAVNQKGPEATFLAALHAMKDAGRKLPVNLVLVAEGEEEIGSTHFSEIVSRPDILAALRKTEGIMLPSASQDTTGGVSIELGAKGIAELELVSSGARWGRGPRKDLHSSYKAAVDSPVWRLVEALQTLVTVDGNKPAVDGWYEHVQPLTARQRELIAQSIHVRNEKAEMDEMGISHWIDDLPFDKAMERLAAEPTINIEGLVAGYTGPGGKTILPGRAVAKIDCRLVPDMTIEEAKRKLRAHLDKRGFTDIEVNVTGGYDPTQTDENSKLIQAQIATYKNLGIVTSINPRMAGSWPGVRFTGPPLNLPAGSFGTGYGTGAHAPDEFFVIESSDPKVAGMDDAALSFVRFLYQIAN